MMQNLSRYRYHYQTDITALSEECHMIAKLILIVTTY